MNYRVEPMGITTPNKTKAPNKKKITLFQVPVKRAPAFRIPKEKLEPVQKLKDRVAFLYERYNKVPPSDSQLRYWERPLVDLLERVNDDSKVLRATHWLTKNWNRNKYIPRVTTGLALNDKFGQVLSAIEREGDTLKPVPAEMRAKRISMNAVITHDVRVGTPFTDELFVAGIPFGLMELSHIPKEIHWELYDECVKLNIPPINLADYGWYLIKYTRIHGKSNIVSDYGKNGALFLAWRQTECH